MATTPPPLRAIQNFKEMVSFLGIALATGFLVHVLLPPNASKTFTLFVMFIAGIAAGVVNAWVSYNFPSTPSVPSTPAGLEG
jgi:hypothetical protein